MGGAILMGGCHADTEGPPSGYGGGLNGHKGGPNGHGKGASGHGGGPLSGHGGPPTGHGVGPPCRQGGGALVQTGRVGFGQTQRPQPRATIQHGDGAGLAPRSACPPPGAHGVTWRGGQEATPSCPSRELPPCGSPDLRRACWGPFSPLGVHGWSPPGEGPHPQAAYPPGAEGPRLSPPIHSRVARGCASVSPPVSGGGHGPSHGAAATTGCANAHGTRGGT